MPKKGERQSLKHQKEAAKERDRKAAKEKEREKEEEGNEETGTGSEHADEEGFRKARAQRRAAANQRREQDEAKMTDATPALTAPGTRKAEEAGTEAAPSGKHQKTTAVIGGAQFFQIADGEVNGTD